VPVALFFVGPIVLGVVHVAADVRYLVLRRAPPRALLAISAAIALAVTALRAAVATHHVSPAHGDAMDVALGAAWIGIALGAAVRDARRIVVGAPAFLAVAALLVANARVVELALAHAHNVVALGAWLLLFRGRRRRNWAIAPLALVVALAAVLLSGATLPWTFARGGLVAFGEHAERLGAWLAPGVRVDRAVAVATTFVFLQGVHYAAWTGWIPQDDLRTEGTPTFRMTVRSLLADFGPVALAIIALVALAFVGAAAFDIRQSVYWYMNLARAHAWLELAFLAYFAARRGAAA